MKIVVAMDSFKGSLSALEACRAVAAGLHRSIPAAEIVLCPMADGGEGTVDTVVGAMQGRWFEALVMGPLPDREVNARFGQLPDSCVLVEMAQASGLELLRRDELDPLATTTYGTGQLLLAALAHDPAKIWLAVGGSATVDGGVGAAKALGWRFLDSDGEEVALGGGELGRIHAIERPRSLELPPVEVLCDVDNPLCGPRGAAPVFGPQKGADAETVERLAGYLENLAAVVERDLGVELHDLPGAGAAGGLAGGGVAFLGARLVSGIDVVMEATGLVRHVVDADWVVTGEGRFDRQSLDGKVVSGVLRLAATSGCRVGVVAGSIDLDEAAGAAAGIGALEASKPEAMSVEQAIAEARPLLIDAAARLADRLGTGTF